MYFHHVFPPPLFLTGQNIKTTSKQLQKGTIYYKRWCVLKPSLSQLLIKKVTFFFSCSIFKANHVEPSATKIYKADNFTEAISKSLGFEPVLQCYTVSLRFYQLSSGSGWPILWFTVDIFDKLCYGNLYQSFT